MKAKHFFPIILLFIGLSYVSYNKYSHHLTPYGNNKKTGKFIQVNGIKMYYEVYGKGEPLLMIHPNDGSIKSMQLQIEYFRKNYKVIAADSRGQGKSELKTDSLTYRQITSDWINLIKKLDLDSINLIGWSDGGIISLMISSKIPDKISKAIAIGANMRPDSSALISSSIFNHMREDWKRISNKKHINPEELRKKQLMGLVLNQPIIDSIELSKISANVLIMAGEHDLVRNEHSIEISNDIPNSELLIIKGGTHFIPVQEPRIVNKRIREFLSQ